MKKKSRHFVYPAIAVGAGALSGFLTRRAMKEVFPLLDKPPLTPPPVVFPIVWLLVAGYLNAGVWLLNR